jgi:hypothetical protein
MNVSRRTTMLADHTLRTGAVEVGIPAYEPPTAHRNSSGSHLGRRRSHAGLIAPPVPITSGSANGATSRPSQSGSATVSSSRNAISGVWVWNAPVLRLPDTPCSYRFSRTVTPDRSRRACRYSFGVWSTTTTTSAAGCRCERAAATDRVSSAQRSSR